MLKLSKTKQPRTAKVSTKVASINESTAISGSFKPFEITYSYFNYTGDDIYVITRENLKTLIRPTPRVANDTNIGIVIVKKYVFHDSIIFDTDTVLDECKDSYDVFIKSFNERRSIGYQRRETEIIYTITPDNLKKCDNSIFVKELDIIVTRDARDMVHPNSQLGMRQREAEQQPMVGISFKWISHTTNLEYKYLRILNEVLMVSSEYDPTTEEGFYVYLRKSSDEYVTLQRFSLEESIEKFSLTTDYQEALTQLSLDERVEKDLEAKRLELKMASMVAEHQQKLEQMELSKSQTAAKITELELKNQLEQEKFEREREQTKLAHQEALRKIELEREKSKREIELLTRKIELEELSNRRKDYYDERSHYRKDSSEQLKWLPSIIVGATLLLKLL